VAPPEKRKRRASTGMPDDNGAEPAAAPPAQLEALRATVDDALRGDCAATAVWYADKLVTLSRGAVEDELRLARAYLAGGDRRGNQWQARGRDVGSGIVCSMAWDVSPSRRRGGCMILTGGFPRRRRPRARGAAARGAPRRRPGRAAAAARRAVPPRAEIKLRGAPRRRGGR
jgi:hypothetical protein